MDLFRTRGNNEEGRDEGTANADLNIIIMM